MGNAAKGKSIEAIARDIADGYIYVNPLMLKGFDADSLKDLYYKLTKVQVDTRTEKYPFNDTQEIRRRNLKLQRLFNSIVILKNYLREKRIVV
ncbi:MAG: hypothetical protein AB1488_09670 [Nitrospirota bacterium]